MSQMYKMADQRASPSGRDVLIGSSLFGHLSYRASKILSCDDMFSDVNHMSVGIVEPVPYFFREILIVFENAGKWNENFVNENTS